jgi:ElaB/YqjD/DUF883 family membrane-anchored ribosome-binding protein
LGPIMAQRKTLRQEIDELRGEIAALQAERQQASARKAKPSPFPAPKAESSGETGVGQHDDLERAIIEFAEAAENEIAEHPAIVVGVAFLLGLMIGRLSRT